MEIAEKVEAIISLNWMSMPQLVCLLIRDESDRDKILEVLPLLRVLTNFDVNIALFPRPELTIPNLDLSCSHYYHEDAEMLKRMFEVCRTHHSASPEKTIFIDFKCEKDLAPGVHFLMQPWICNLAGVVNTFNKSTRS